MLTVTNYKYRNFTTSKIACFINVDPKYQEYPQMSSYTAMGNNPVTNIDPDGMKFTPAMEKWIAKYRKAMKTRLSTREDKVSGLEKDIRNEKNGKNRQKTIDKYNKILEKANKELQKYETEFTQIEVEIEKLQESNQIYDIEIGNDSSGKGAMGQTYFNKGNNKTIMKLTKEKDSKTGALGLPDIKYFAHELKHMYQFEVGTLSIPFYTGMGEFKLSPISKNFLYSFADEQEATERQLFFGYGDTGVLKNPQKLLSVDSQTGLINIYNNLFNSYNAEISKSFSGQFDLLGAAINWRNKNILLETFQNAANTLHAVYRIQNTTYVPQ